MEGVEMQTLPGDSIYRLIPKAVDMANKRQKVVWFDFNDEQIHVAPGDDATEIAEAWEDRQDLARREYRASTAYVKAETERALDVQYAQKRMNRLLLDFNTARATGLRHVLRWLVDFTSLADVHGVLIPHKRLAQKLGKIAPANANVGRTDLNDPGNERDAGLWVIGQAVAALEQEKSPHMILAGFAHSAAKRLAELEEKC